jgi:hypothetical protein
VDELAKHHPDICHRSYQGHSCRAETELSLHHRHQWYQRVLSENKHGVYCEYQQVKPPEVGGRKLFANQHRSVARLIWLGVRRPFRFSTTGDMRVTTFIFFPKSSSVGLGLLQLLEPAA